MISDESAVLVLFSFEMLFIRVACFRHCVALDSSLGGCFLFIKAIFGHQGHRDHSEGRLFRYSFISMSPENPPHPLCSQSARAAALLLQRWNETMGRTKLLSLEGFDISLCDSMKECCCLMLVH